MADEHSILSLKTVVHLTNWVVQQSQPKPPKKVLFVTQKTTSDAMKEFMTQYTRLVKSGLTSNTAFNLYRQVVRAETAKDLIQRLPAMRREVKVKDHLCQLQFMTFKAANWVRRFAEDRYDPEEWDMFYEKQEAHQMNDNLEMEVSRLFSFVLDKTGSKTTKVAFDAFNVNWKQEDKKAEKLAEKRNQATLKLLEKAFGRVKEKSMTELTQRQQTQFISAVDELEDSKGELDAHQGEVVNKVKEWMVTERPAQPWRTDGIKTLGPFGIAGNIDAVLEIDVDKSEFVVVGPKEEIEAYEKGLGGVVGGKLSPLSPVTVKRKDPIAELLRIPINAKFFAFAYPVITAELEVHKENKSASDAFLLFGGYVYFDDKKKFIQANALWVGNQLQLGAPKPLPPAVRALLEEQGRFHDITLPHLWEAGARQFAWINPQEFPEYMKINHGGWCYKYEREEVSNYFCLASADSVRGVTTTATTVRFD